MKAQPTSTISTVPAHPRPALLFVTADPGLYASTKVAFRKHVDVEVVPTPAAALCHVTLRRPTIMALDVQHADPSMHLLLTRLSGAASVCPILLIAAATQADTLRTLASFPISGFVQRPVEFGELHRSLTVLLALASANGQVRPVPFTRCVAKVFGVLAGEYRDGVTRTALAKTACLSPSHLAFKVRSETGLTITECLTHIRLEVAKFHLAHSDAKLQAISHQTGFYDASHLARVFQKHGYPPPTAYRRDYTFPPTSVLQLATA